ncbi:MAG: alpha-glucan family phosphorylase [Gemmatimonadetes bacterium]|nr:alpha-glucan family phosphorylase [Gemmatimonadota bacterium]
MNPSVAYFSMEIALEASIPTYAGGLGVLAGDTLRAAADLELPMIAVTLLHRSGYFTQRIGPEGVQYDEPARWSPEERLEPLDARLEVHLGDHRVRLRAWRYGVEGVRGGAVPVYLLDSDVPENGPDCRSITDRLYGDGPVARLRQEAVLGLGGIALLEAIGVEVDVHHLNEGHSALLAVALLERGEDLEAIRRRCVFTTHTPVPAGHDRFAEETVREVLGPGRMERLREIGAMVDGSLDMTRLALAVSRRVNGVSLRHAEVSREMFPGREMDAITNGVHVATWVSPPFAELFDRRLPGWREESANLRHAIGIELDEVEAARGAAKRNLIEVLHARGRPGFSADRFTIGFARRATAYKRADLLFGDLDRLRSIAARHGGLQVVYGGKAHPRDEEGRAMIRRVVEAARGIGDDVSVVWLEEYDMALAGILVAGVDLWLNTPRKPLEASGTSGMKAALNGVPSLSVLDGWWIEGCVDGMTGWAIGDDPRAPSDPAGELESLYRTLDEEILPTWRDRPEAWAAVSRWSIALNGSWFTARRMLLQYVQRAYSR